MNRRVFFKSTNSIVFTWICNRFGIGLSLFDYLTINFGIVTDLHYAKINALRNRYYHHSLDKLNEAVTIFNDNELDFIIELGDFKDQGETKEQTISFLDEIEAAFIQFKGPVFHVLGNHDMDNIDKKDFLDHTKNAGDAKGKSYYSFIKKGIKFIVLDANYNKDGSSYNSGNFDWKEAYIPKPQQEWLVQELQSDYPAIVFLHQLLDLTQQQHQVCVINASEIIEILEKSNKVLAVFQGHHHNGSYSFSNNIHFYTLKGMVEGKLPENNSFAIVSIDKFLKFSIKGFYNCEDKYF